METFRCPTCLFVLIEPNPTRCPSCHRRLTGRRRPIVLGDRTKFGTHPLEIDLVRLERLELEAAENAEQPPAPVTTPQVVAPRVATPPVEREPIRHTPIFEPSQLGPEMREMLDDLLRKARADLDEES